MFCKTTRAAAFLIAGVFVMVGGVRVEADTLTFDFDSGLGPNFSGTEEGDFWTIDADGPTVRIAKPADDGSYESNGWARAKVESVFTAGGDFTATVDFTLHDFPGPSGRDMLNESLFSVLPTSGGEFSVLRFMLGPSKHRIEAGVTPGGALGLAALDIMEGRYQIKL